MKSVLILLAFCAAAARAQSPAHDAGEYAPDCEHGADRSACEHHTAIFTRPNMPSGYGLRTLEIEDLTTYGPSINFGNSGGWTITHVIDAPHVVFGTSGIDQFLGATMVKNGTGDLAGLYVHAYGGGRAAQSDEGVTGLTVESGEIGGYFHGSIASGGRPGSTSLNLTDNSAAPLDWKYTCDGCMLLDLSKGSIAGKLNGKAIPVADTYLMQLPTTNDTVDSAPARLPLTHAWCALTTAIPPTVTAGVGTSRTVNCKLGQIAGATPPFHAGQIASLAGQYYPEQVLITAAGEPDGGMQSLTFAARNPNPAGSFLFQGGIAGQSLSFDDNLSFTGFRTSYYVFGSLDGTNLIYGSQVAGEITRNPIPRPGSDAETTTSGFHLYPSAEIVANSAQPSAPTLEPNSVEWANGDMVENPRFQSYGGVGIWDQCQAYTPSDGSVSAGCMHIHLYGPGVAGTYHPFRMINHNPPTLYKADGGKLSAVPAFETEGPFSDMMIFSDGPAGNPLIPGAVIAISHTARGDNTPFDLFSLPSGRIPGTTFVTYDPATHLIGFPQGIVAGSLATLQDCAVAVAHPDCGQAASGSIVLQPGTTSVLVAASRVTAASEILITPDTSLGAKLGIHCNQDLPSAFAPFGITARTPGRNFTLSIATPAQAPNCYSFTIIN